MFLAVVILLVFLFSGVFGGDGEGGGTAVEGPGIRGVYGEMPGLPPGLVALSRFVELETEGDVSATIVLPLETAPEDEAAVGFYTYDNGRWQRIADARLTREQRAEADLSPLPGNLAVLRVVAQAYQVAASLPQGGTLHPDAEAGIISPRDYKPLSDASLEGTPTDVGAGDSVLLIPTIVGSGEDTAAVVNDILASDSLRVQHVREIVRLVESGGFAGIDLEYSAVDPELRSEFSEFVEGLGLALREDGRRLSLTLPPPGPQRQAYDWPLLGEAADILKILPIADPLDYWEMMPEAFDQLVEDVDPRKVMLVVSPFSAELADRGESRTLGFLEAMLLASEIKVREPADPEKIETDTGVKVVAVNLAQSEGATDLRWSDEAAVISFSYGAPEKRTVYIENVFSAGFKLEIVQVYALGGVAVSDASAEADVANIWPAVNRLIETGTVTLVRPNGDELVARWEAPDGGNLDATTGPAVIWRSDQPGSFKLRMLIGDGDKRFGRELTVEVKEKEEPQPTRPPLVEFPPDTATPSATPTPSPVPTPTATATPAPTTCPGPPAGDTPPDQVKNFTAGTVGVDPGDVILTWKANPPPDDVDHYNVYRVEAGGAKFDIVITQVTETGLNAYAYVDTPPGPGTYCYAVSAVDSADNEGPLSEPDPATVE